MILNINYIYLDINLELIMSTLVRNALANIQTVILDPIAEM